MAQTTILAAGTSAATSTDITLADGQTCIIGLFMATAVGIALDPSFPLARVMIDTPGTADAVFHTLTPKDQVVTLSAATGTGGATFRVARSDCPLSVGVFKNQA